MRDRQARLVENQNLFRTANERLGERVQAYGADDAVPFLCECADMECLGRIELTLVEYGDVRAKDNRFIILRGHRMIEGERVVEDGENFQIVEKDA